MISIFSCTDAEENPQAFLCRLYERYARLMYSVASKHLPGAPHARRSEEHTSELQSLSC